MKLLVTQSGGLRRQQERTVTLGEALRQHSVLERQVEILAADYSKIVGVLGGE